jgi:hypothetical protein
VSIKIAGGAFFAIQSTDENSHVVDQSQIAAQFFRGPIELLLRSKLFTAGQTRGRQVDRGTYT